MKNQNDPKVRETNILILKQIMDLLYETHITEQKTATYRGAAIQAVDKMLQDFSCFDEIKNKESEMYSVRMRKSEIWNAGEEE